ncbi:hypothetical protein AB0K00_02950 [Dactylosporangium sp. NPDC049525]|uniref:hypothetical protein n=1 Tax=Dactylosporangium sp. NPDC049525 TaxID=3154730 RepID=UPI0034380A90
MSIDQHLSDQLHALVDREPGSAPPTRVLLERGRRARRRRTATRAGVTVAATVAVATGFVALQPAGPAGPGGTAGPATTTTMATQESTPQLRLAAAVAASGSTSYAFTISMVPKPVDGATLTAEEERLLVRSRTAQGEFDPASTTGVLRYDDGGEQRLVNGERFIGDGKGHWKFQNDGRHDTLTFSGLGDDPIAMSSDAPQLLKTLEDAGSVKEVSPGVYRFHTQGPAGQASPGATYDQPGFITTGEVTVRDGKVAKVSYLSPLFQGGPAPKVRAAVVVEFSDYGKQVIVQKPAHWVD